MKKTVLFAIALCGFATAAQAQTGYCCTSAQYGCWNCVQPCTGCMSTITLSGSGESFSTVHTWTQSVPGVLALTGTKFTISWNWTDFQYHLKFGDHEIMASFELSRVKSEGVARAQDLQSVGVSLDTLPPGGKP
jgi:hypothetical protein